MKKAYELGLLKGFKGHMNLQMFAEDGTNSTNTEGNKTPETKQEAKYTDEDVNKIIDKKFAEWEKKRQKQVDEAKKLAEMNAQQKAEYERDELQKQLNDYKRKDTISEMTKTARSMLSEQDINVSDTVISFLVSEDAEATKKAVDGFAKAFKSEVDKQVKEALKGNPPRKATSTTNVTKESIMKIADRKERQRMIKEHRDLF